MLLSKTKIRNITFITGFCTLLLYNFHRYIFKYNAEGTSPTYANTPLVWKIGKYIILSMILVVFYAVLNYTQKISKWFLVIYGLILLVLVINLLNFIIYGVFDTEETEYCYWFLLLIPYCFSEDSIFSIKLNYDKLLTVAAVILFLSNGLALANYFLTGRLPALGYEGGLSRFGGFWDDPNSFGIICVFYFYYFVRRERYFLTGIAVVSIIITFSFTAYLLLLLSIVYWTIPTYKTFNKKWALFGISTFLLLAGIFVYFFDLIMSLYEIKSVSVSEHLTKKMIFNLVPLDHSPLQFSENWFESSFYNYFPLSIIIHLCFLILFLSLFKNGKYKDLKFFFFLFIAASAFFSMLYTFPINFIFIFLLTDYIKGFKHKYLLGSNNDQPIPLQV